VTAGFDLQNGEGREQHGHHMRVSLFGSNTATWEPVKQSRKSHGWLDGCRPRTSCHASILVQLSVVKKGGEVQVCRSGRSNATPHSGKESACNHKLWLIMGQPGVSTLPLPNVHGKE